MRIELLCSLTNAILLLYISFNLFSEALIRVIDPPPIGDEHLILVSVLGLFVNLIGLFFTGGCSSSESSLFLRSIFLHVLVDTLGSVAVIFSSICIAQFNVFIWDPICSLLIAVSIFFTAIPLLRDVVDAFMLASPRGETVVNDLMAFGSVCRINTWSGSEQMRIATVAIRGRQGTMAYEELLHKVLAFFDRAQYQDVTVELLI
jgi:cation diffusion facilitator family transporter